MSDWWLGLYEAACDRDARNVYGPEDEMDEEPTLYDHLNSTMNEVETNLLNGDMTVKEAQAWSQITIARALIDIAETLRTKTIDVDSAP